MSNKHKYATLALIIAISSLVIAFFSYKLYVDPDIFYLSQNSKAEWIKYDRPFNFIAQRSQQKIVQFRKYFQIDHQIDHATLEVRSFKFSRVFLDNQLVFESSTKPVDWKSSNKITLKNISSGPHTLLFLVMNYDGPPALYANSDILNLRSDQSWESSLDNKSWQKVALINKRSVTDATKSYGPSYKYFYDTIPAAILLVLACIGAYFLSQKQQVHKYITENPHKIVSYSRYAMLILWVILAVLSLLHHPISGGDFPAHLQYIFYIAIKSRLPLASDGWQMFQAPLYYVVSALTFKFFHLFLEPQTSYQLLKLIPLASGIAIADISHRTVKYAFPNQYSLQVVGTFVGGLMPMNLYLSQYIGNEIAASVFSALLVMIMVNMIRNPEKSLQIRYQLFLGATLGLGLLTKVSVGLLLVPCFCTFAWIVYIETRKFKIAVTVITRISVIVFIFAGWYYLRNLIYFDNVFVMGKSNNVPWWQDPGYRIADNYMRFGLSLIYPINSCTVGFWDALYSSFWLDSGLGGNINPASRPPWNYPYMLSLPLLSIAPTILMITGIYPKLGNFGKNDNSLYWFCLSIMVIYFSAILIYYTKIPIYSAGKSTYAMGLIPCFTIIFVKGFNTLNHGKKSLALLVILTAIWCFYSYYSFLPIHS